MSNTTIDLQNYNAWKTQLTITIKFSSPKDAEEEHVIQSMSSNKKFTPYRDANEIIDELFKSPCSKYQIILETSKRGSDFISGSITNFFRSITNVIE